MINYVIITSYTSYFFIIYDIMIYRIKGCAYMTDKGNRLAIIIVIVMFLIVGVVAIVKHNWDNDVERPKGDYLAIITHSERKDNDNGIEYTYYIYNSKKSYIYIKTKAIVTKDGVSKEEEVASGRLKKKKDMDVIKKDIEKDTEEGNIKYVYYAIKDNGKLIKYDSIDKIKNVLW